MRHMQRSHLQGVRPTPRRTPCACFTANEAHTLPHRGAGNPVTPPCAGFRPNTAHGTPCAPFTPNAEHVEQGPTPCAWFIANEAHTLPHSGAGTTATPPCAGFSPIQRMAPHAPHTAQTRSRTVLKQSRARCHEWQRALHYKQLRTSAGVTWPSLRSQPGGNAWLRRAGGSR